MNDVAQRCIGCGAEPPPTNPDFTLVSALGWRLTAAVEDGQKVMQWRCPACWSRYRRRIGLSRGT